MSLLKTFLASLLFVLLLSFVSASVDVTEDEGVLVLTEENFDRVIAQEKFILVEFYAPWCGHCKQLAPNYAAAAQQLKEEGSAAKLGKVDATIHSKLGQRYGVSGYPTLKFFKNGSPTEYSGGRTKDEILQWIRKKSGPASSAIETAEQLEKVTSSHPVVVVGRFVSDDKERLNNFISVAGDFDDLVFVHTTADVLSEELGNKEGDAVVLLKNFDEKINVYDGDYSAASINQFVQGNSQPLVQDFTAAPKLFSSPIKDHFFLFLAQGDHYEPTLERLREVAKVNKGRVLFSYVDVANAAASRLVDYFNVKESTTSEAPQVRFFRLESNSKFKPEADQSWVDFVNTIFDETAAPFLKSEEPVAYSGKGVRVLTGKDHDAVAKDAQNNVFVEYYAPWCGHCKQLAPIWDQLAAEYDDVENVVIAKFDGTTNEVQGVQIQGFPTLYFYPAGGSSSIQYQGERNFKSLKDYIEKNSVGLTRESPESL